MPEFKILIWIKTTNNKRSAALFFYLRSSIYGMSDPVTPMLSSRYKL
jgi:hypothetical protein